MDQNNTPVVYYYLDPEFHGDMTAPLNVLSEMGCRVVKGDNADELMFLLQVGRPSAIVYTLSSVSSRSDAGYRLVTSRAFELLVPVILAGPDDPREGFIMLLPEQGDVREHHVPVHSIGDTLASLHQAPPSTPSRPPAKIAQQTMGKGQGVMSYDGAGSRVLAVEPRSSSVPPPPAESLSNEGKPLVRTVESFRGEDGEKLEVASSEPVAEGDGLFPVWKRVVLGVFVVAVLGVGIGSYFLAGQMKAADGTDIDESADEQTTPVVISSPVASPVVSPSAPAAQPDSVKEPVPAARQTEPAAPSEQASASASTPSTVPDMQIPDNLPTQRDKVRPGASAPASAPTMERMVFPGRFKKGSAQFWFEDNMDKVRVMKFIRSRPEGTKVRVIGHPTVSDIAEGKPLMGRGRAWAVQKFLKRRGLKDDVLLTEKGDPVPDITELDEKGRATNRWVELVIE